MVVAQTHWEAVALHAAKTFTASAHCSAVPYNRIRAMVLAEAISPLLGECHSLNEVTLPRASNIPRLPQI